MIQLTEQLSAVRNTQLEAQLDVFRTLTGRALDSAGQLFALNIKTSRQSVEQAAGTFRHLLDARDPRDLLEVGRDAQNQWQNLFSYGREVFGIATGMPALNWVSAPSLLPASAPAAPAPAAAAPAAAAPAAAAPAAQVVEQAAVAEAAAEAAIADDMPPATPTPVAKALQEMAPLPASAEHPIAAPVFLDAAGEVELPAVDPVDSAPPVQVTAGPTPKPGRGSRKK
jgi:hypothetical protein